MIISVFFATITGKYGVWCKKSYNLWFGAKYAPTPEQARKQNGMYVQWGRTRARVRVLGILLAWSYSYSA
jgi:hypothetical protein